MSLINQMLKDIDQRQAGVGTSTPLGVLSASPARGSSGASRSSTWIWGGLVAVLAGAAVGVYGYRGMSSVPSDVVVAAPSVVPSPVAVAAPVVATVAAPSAAPQPAKAQSAQTPLAQRKKPDQPAQIVQDRPTMHATVESRPVEVAPAPVQPAPAAGQVTRMVSAEQRAENTYRQAIALLRQGQSPQAQTQLRQALQDNPMHQDARLLYARLLREEGQSAQAKGVLQAGLAHKPANEQMYMALAHLQLVSKDLDGALQTLEQGAVVAADHAEYNALWGTALQQKSRHADAVQHYVIALRQFPEAANWLVGLGVSLQALGNRQGAAEAYARALDLGLPASLAKLAGERLDQVQR